MTTGSPSRARLLQGNREKDAEVRVFNGNFEKPCPSGISDEKAVQMRTANAPLFALFVLPLG